MPRSSILYLGSTLPSRSETFVYREVQALRALGIAVKTATVHAPASDLGSDDLEQMAAESIRIYSAGVRALVRDASLTFLRQPLRSVGTLVRASMDAIFSRDLKLSSRPKVLVQAMAALALSSRLRAHDISHIHAHMAHVPTTLAMYTARQIGVGFSFTGHANDLFVNRSLLGEKLDRCVFSNCISLWHREFYQEITSRPDEDLPVVRCGVDTARYEATQAPGGDSLRVLAVGRLVEKKGFDVLVEAAGIIAASDGPSLKISIAGGGNEHDKLSAQIAALPDAADIELLGETSNHRVMELMGQVDVFALPCRVAKSGDRDGIPVVLMEAMARGRCVISGDIVTIRELIDHDQNGLMIPPGDVDALVVALTSLAKDRGRVDRLGKEARLRIEDEFDLNLNARRIKAALERAGTIA